MRRRAAVVVAVVTLLLTAFVPASAPAQVPPVLGGAQGSNDAVEAPHIPECLQAIPAATAVSGERTNLDVRVLLDGVSRAQGRSIMNEAATSYAPLDIVLKPSYQTVSLGGNSSTGVIDQAKRLFDGRRPAGSDVVHVLTNKNLQAGGSEGVAGQADCIGGVAFPERAFSAGEASPEGDLSESSDDPGHLAAVVTAHEIGHLMGGQHHYANCIEPALSSGGLCTLMFSPVLLSPSLDFSTLNGLVVRGHANAFLLR